MPKVEIDGNFDAVIKAIERAGGDTRQVVEEVLKATFDVITPLAEDAIAKPNLPAGGKYSTGNTERSLLKTPKLKWENDTAYVDVGFSIKKGGLPSIFMISGSPRYMKNQALYNAFYGESTKEAVNKVQREILTNYLDKQLGG